MKKISVIVPVHNSEETLERTIKSLVRQKGISVKILLVENCSDDLSLNLCRQYESRWEEVQCFSLREASVSKARNYGLCQADTEYVGFVDSDDFVDENMYAAMVEKAEQYAVPVVLCQYVREFVNGETVKDTSLDTVCNKQEKELWADCIRRHMVGKNKKEEPTIMGSVWRGIYKKEFLLDNNIRFLERLTIGEDLLFMLQVLRQAGSVGICDGAFYHYTVGMDGVTSHFDAKTWEKYEALYNTLLEEFKDNKEDMDYYIRLNNTVKGMSRWIILENLRSKSFSIMMKFQLLIDILISQKRIRNRIHSFL